MTGRRLAQCVTVMIAAVTSFGAGGPDPAHAPREANMNGKTMTSVQEFPLPDEVYYSDLDGPFDRMADALAPNPDHDASSPVFALGMPRVADLMRAPAIPGALLRRYSGLRLWEVDSEQNLSFIIVDLRTGAVQVPKAFQPDDRARKPPEPSRSGPEPSGIDRSVLHYGAERFTLPAAFGGTWPSTAFAVTAILYDWVSNTVEFERRPPPEFVPDPVRAPSPFLDPAPPGDAPPPSGFTVKVPNSASPGAPIRIAGALATPKLSVALARSAEEPDGAVMVATLLLVALDAARPVMVGLVVPVAVRGDTVSATFAFDLAQRPEGTNLVGEYQAYLVSGRTVVGPNALTIARR
jgi:hypothetical protein